MTVKLVYDTDEYYSVTLKENLRNAMCRVDEDEVKEILEKQVEREEEIENIVPDTSLDLLLTTAILNNEAVIVPVTDKKKGEPQIYEIIGNPTDGALLVLAMTNGLHVDTIRKRYLKERIYPFDSTVKRMSGLFKDTLENDYMVLSKGATEVILPRCTKIGNENDLRNFTKKKKEEIQAKVDSFANDGYRVISLAYKPIEDIPKMEDEAEEREFMESELNFIGFAIIYDPPRPGVLKAVNELDNAGIFPIMITGDAPTTAATIARQVGILDPDEMVVEGKEAATLIDDDFFKVSVFARVSPQDKEIIVARYQKRGDVVAMTGDGVNDALAITKSDAGVAMGITGTEVAKEAADIIISDDSYVSLVKGVEEGRNLYEKIRMLIFFYIAVNIAEAIVYFTMSFRLDFQILNNWQRVYIFSIIHALPVLAIIFGPQDRNIMMLKPRDNDALIPKRLSVGLAMFAITFALTILFIYQVYYEGIFGFDRSSEKSVTEWNKSIDITFRGANAGDPNDQLNAEHWPHAKARTMILSIIYLTEAMLVFSIRRINSGIIRFDPKDSSITVWVLILAAPIMHFILMYFTAYQDLFHDAGFQVEILRLNLIDLAIVGIAALLPILVLEFFKLYHRKKGIQL